MEDEVAKCMAEGIADRMLDALEKKVKRQIGDVSENEIPAGLGKLYFCRVEDVEKDPKEDYFALDKPVSLLKPGMLTYKDDEPKSEYSAKGYSIGFNATMEEPGPELLELLVTPPNRWDVKLERKPGRMPRKMNKAYRSDYPRNTKWTRKVANYIRRMSMTLHDAEIVVTKEQRDRLSDVLNVEMEIRRAKEETDRRKA